MGSDAILGLQPRDKAAMLVVNATHVHFFGRIYKKMVVSSQRRETLLFLVTKMATMTSHANQQGSILDLVVLCHGKL